jgi:2-C-methyl-D-erythritol 4-phosphate cytidylyltransferase
MKYYALIVAGGSGSRMNSDIPKQFLLLNNKPVLIHSIEAFYHSDLQPEIIVVLNSKYYKHWEDICIKYNFNIPHKLAKGGNQRFDSVKNGLKEVKEESIIAVHDAVRPIINNELITRAFLEAEVNGTAIAAVTGNDSIRQMQKNTSVALNRETIFLIQTPQAFRSEILKKAYQQPYRNEFTDDASVVEKLGVKINIIHGSMTNIKITHPEDLRIAQLFLKETLL